MERWRDVRRWLLIGTTMAIGVTSMPLVSDAEEELPRWAVAVSRAFYAAYNSGDLAALMRHYAVDAAILLDDQTVRGRGAIEAYFSGEFVRARSSCEWAIDGVRTVGRQAAVWGHERCVESPKSGEAPSTFNAEWLTTWERQADGSWLIVRDAIRETAP